MTLLSHPRLSLVRVYLRQASRSLLSALRVLAFGPRRSFADTVLTLTDTALPPHPSTLCACSCGHEGALKDHDAGCKWLAVMCRACEGRGWCPQCQGEGLCAEGAAESARAHLERSAPEVVGVLHSMNLATDALSHDIDGSFVIHAKLAPLSEAHRNFVASMRAWKGQPIRVALHLID